MLELRPSCEHCQTLLDPVNDDARICTYECTFCSRCATWELLGICPNCGGEFVTRPRRPASHLAKDPAGTRIVHKTVDIPAHQAMVLKRLADGTLPEQLWVVAFANGRSESLGRDDGYLATAERMDELARQQPGFVSVDAARTNDGVGMTVSRWSSIAAMVAWRRVITHAEAQTTGRDRWYQWYRSDVARVDRVSEYRRESDSKGTP